ncbi:lysylphosphatidylglycerol synthase transmembrane domain-containing protein [Vibrio sp. 99-8-1]|uniref:lysylphosphatidylglycerol synthase transmembrane domain-containing protein n=1 Tax=Vibrio sp. 99-8-1 TaxID=2607602 RepID=UPI001493DC5F|nr:lysylphosphatidylglycerol synthase transmembrane domain-containing protein [Vibrio sp. 99-8-1]NOI66724.1 flippase-like domain-containing protein [Vibrio sp. 99-8-1]
MKHRSALISVLTFLSVIVAVQAIWGWDTLLSFWSTIPTNAVIFFTLLYWFSYLVRSYRISIYFNSPRIQLPTKVVLPIVIKQTFWANLLPAKAGEISFPILMKKAFSTPYSHSVPALLVLRLFDAYVLASIAVAIFSFPMAGVWVLAWLLVSFFIPLVGISLRRQLIGLTYKHRARNKVKFIWQILTNIPDSKKKLLRMTALSWLNWGIKIFLFAALLASMTPLLIEQTTIAALFGEVSGMLPGLPGGFGSYEAAVSFGLMSSGADLSAVSSKEIVAAALNSHFFILFNSIFGAMIVFMLPKKSTIETSL